MHRWDCPIKGSSCVESLPFSPAAVRPFLESSPSQQGAGEGAGGREESGRLVAAWGHLSSQPELGTLAFEHQVFGGIVTCQHLPFSYFWLQKYPSLSGQQDLRIVRRTWLLLSPKIHHSKRAMIVLTFILISQE